MSDPHRRPPRARPALLSGLALACALPMLAASLPALAQADKPLRILVGFPPGGSADTIARLLAERLPSQLGGQTVTVENKPGAAGRIAIDALKNAAPDGSTLLSTVPASRNRTAPRFSPHRLRSSILPSATDRPPSGLWLSSSGPARSKPMPRIEPPPPA